MSNGELEVRVRNLEERLDAVITVVNKLMEDIFEPEYLEKIDRLVDYGEGEG